MKVPDFIDEWVSAPYPTQVKDREVVIPGLADFEKFMNEKYGSLFPNSVKKSVTSPARRSSTDGGHSIDSREIRYDRRRGILFDQRRMGRDWICRKCRDSTFEGPPKDVLEKVGVEQTCQLSLLDAFSGYLGDPGYFPETFHGSQCVIGVVLVFATVDVGFVGDDS